MNTSILAISGISIKQDSHGRFCLNDLHKASGGEARHKPSNWLALQQVQELIAELSDEITKSGIPALEQNQPLTVIHGGVNRGTYGMKEIIYAYATWISAKFFLRVIRAYDSLVNNTPKQHTLPDYINTPRHNTPAGLPELLNARMTAQQKIMLLILGRYADENGQCQISIGDLAPLCGIERSTTSKNLTDLVEAGFLTVTKTRYEHGGSQPNIYTIPERFRFVSGELVNEPIAVEYQPPKGMMLIAESEFEALQKVEPIPAPQPVFSIPKNMVMISTERFIELEKYSISNEHYFRKLPAKRTNVKEMLECLDVGMNLITDALDDLELGRKDNIDTGINKILAGLLAMRRYQPRHMQADYCG